MKAMIFAAGLGTRLRPLTDHLPKALVPVAGEPMLKRVMLKLKAAGFNEITINVHYLGEQILEYLRVNQDFGLTVHISDERGRLLDTGGGILKARPYLDGDEPFLVHNVDILSDLDLRAFYASHVQRGADATLLVSSRKTTRYLLLDDEQHLCGWHNVLTGEFRPAGFVPDWHRQHSYAFGGIHVCSPGLFRLMDTGEWSDAFSIISFYLQTCQQANIQGHLATGLHWFDIGKPETLEQATRYLQGEGMNLRTETGSERSIMGNMKTVESHG